MDQLELEKKVREVFSDENYVKELFGLETAEEVQASLEEKGLSLSIDEIMNIKRKLEEDNGELTDEELEAVNGGSVLAIASIIIGSIGALISGASLVDSKTRGRW